MDYEKKYKEALERAEGIIKYYKECNRDEASIEDLETIFPELKESEDERIRKSLLDYLHTLPNHFSHDGSLVIDWIAWLEKQGEQKPIDKVEPKFHEGEWIISKYMHLVMQILNNDNGSYKTLETDGTERNDSYDFIERNFKLWTIQDAKDGDVLAESKGDVILMFRGIGNARWDDVIDYHFYYDCYRENFIVQEDVNYWGNTENNQLKPATKEQRDLLFSKMKEAGYEFDFEQKELKEIELTKSESEEELSDFEAALFSAFSDGWQQYLHGEEVDFAQWAKEHSAELLEAANQNHVAWSEEDECYMSECIGAIATKDGWSFEEKRKTKHWLKSLKERYTWKPSESDIRILEQVISGTVNPINYHATLYAILEQLKKLKD